MVRSGGDRVDFEVTLCAFRSGSVPGLWGVPASRLCRSGLRTGDSVVSSRRRRLQRNSAICIDLYIRTVVMNAIFAQTFM